MTSLSRRILDAEALQAAYRDGVRSFRNVVITGQLAGLDLEGVDFSAARFQNVRFDGNLLTNLNFERAVLSNVIFSNVTLTGGTFTHAFCKDVEFRRSLIAQSHFNDLEVSQTDLQFVYTSLEDCNFSQSDLYKIDFSQCGKLQGLDFTLAHLRGTRFRGTTLHHCTFLHTDIAGADFREVTLTDTTFELATFGTIASWQKALLFALPAIAMATPPMLLTYRFFFWGWTAALPSFLLGCLGIVLAAIPLLLAFCRQETSFRRSNLAATRFEGAQLTSVSFCEANCTGANFQHVTTGIASSNFRGFALIYLSLLITVITIVLVAYLGVSFWGILETFNTNDIGPDHSKFLAYVALVVVGFAYFLANSLFKNLDIAIWSLPLTAIAVFLVNFRQPVLNFLVWGLAIYALFETFKVLTKLNFWLTIVTAALLLGLSLSALFQYDSITTENLTTLRTLPIVLMVTVFTALRTGAAIAEVGFFTNWPFGLVVVIAVIIPATLGGLGSVLGGTSLAVYMSGTPTNDLGSIILLLLLSAAIFVGMLLGTYFGWQALRDRPEYRLIRDRGVFLNHWFGQFGTKFKATRLADANFAFATLKNADFLHAQLDHVCWYGATNLAGDRFGRSYLRYPAVRKLVARRQGLYISNGKRARRLVRSLQQLPKGVRPYLQAILASPPTTQLAHYDLRKIRLSHWQIDAAHRSLSRHFNLSQMNFHGANLQGADLRGANLQGTNFSEAQLAQADLRNTELTNLCIRNWQVDESTNFASAHCQQVYLDYEDPETQTPVSISLGDRQNSLDHQVFKNLLLQAEDVEDITQLEQEFTKIDSIQNKIHREYKLNQLANQASEKYGIESDRYRQMFEHHLRAKRQAGRKKSWWQSFLWFRIEPKIERFNQLTQELDIFPLLENLGRLSILVAVITFVNNALKPPDLNLEQYYRSWEIILSDTEQVRGAKRFALEQLRGAEGGLVGISAVGQDLQGINLRGADLTGANLSESNLSAAVLSGATLEAVNLRDATLNGTQFGYRKNTQRDPSRAGNFLKPSFLRESTNLDSADLTRADLTQANLAGVDLNNAILIAATLENSDLTRADLEQADLRNANLTAAKLIRTDLSRANLRQANLTGVQLTKANLQRSLSFGINLRSSQIMDVNYSQANLQKANLQNANISGTNFQRSNLRGADLRGATISNSNFSEAVYDAATQVAGAAEDTLSQGYLIAPQSDLTAADMANADLSEASLAYASLNSAILRSANLAAAELRGADLSLAILTDANAEVVDGRYATLVKANLQNINLEGADLSSIDASGAMLLGANLKNANLASATLVEANLVNADLTNANLDNADLTGADLTNARMTNVSLNNAIYCNTTLPNGQVLNRDC